MELSNNAAAEFADLGKNPDDRYVQVSSDCHAGATIQQYRPYLESRWHEEFDDWAANYKGTEHSADFGTSARDWDSPLRLRELADQGVVGEVVFPNTIPPFFPMQSFFTMQPPKTRDDYERRWAGLKAHNRWLVDFCGLAPGQRAGCAQVMLNDVDDAVAEVKWAAHAGLPSVLVPGAPPGGDLPPLYDSRYEPLWAACAEYDMVMNNHGAGGTPDYDMTNPVAVAAFLAEAKGYTRNIMTELMYAGVFARHPNFKLVLTEQGTGWLPGYLDVDQMIFRRIQTPGTQENLMCGSTVGLLPKTPRDYFRENVFLGSSFLHRAEAEMRYEIGVDKIMFGVDYPHHEGTSPYTHEALRATFAGIPPAEVQVMLGGTAAKLFKLDWAKLRTLADEVGPKVADVGKPLTSAEVPADSVCVTFSEEYALAR